MLFYFCKDSEDDQNEDDFSSRIPSTLFLMIMEESIRTFMNFLKADREKHCQLLAALFRRNRKSAVDPTLLRVMKKANKKVSLTRYDYPSLSKVCYFLFLLLLELCFFLIVVFSTCICRRRRSLMIYVELVNAYEK